MAGIALAIHRQSSRGPAPKFRTQLDVNSLAQFVDPLPIPEIAKSNELRPSPDNPAVKLPYFRIPMRAICRQSSPRPEADAPVGIQWKFSGTDF